MAKIKNAGGAVALVSDLALEDIRLLEQYRPKALILKESDDEVFKVSTGTDGSITKFGVCFAAATRNSAALAEHTLLIPADVTNVTDYAVEKIGPAVLLLKRVEAQAVEALKGIKEELAQVRAAVEVS